MYLVPISQVEIFVFTVMVTPAEIQALIFQGLTGLGL